MAQYEVRELQSSVPDGWKQLKVYADGRYLGALQQGKFRPYIYPLFSPAGHNVLQIAPVDHLHHLGIWFSHSAIRPLGSRREPQSSLDASWSDQSSEQAVPEIDFWGTESFLPGPLPRILVRSTQWEIGDRGVQFQQMIEWQDDAGQTVLRERRLTVMAAGPSGNHVDLVTTLEAPGGSVEFGQIKDAGIGVRVSDEIDVLDGGRIVNADGDENEAETFGKASAWVDYSGPVTPDAIAGVAMFPFPNAAGIPWHTRDYGPMWINPWQDSAMTLAAGETYSIGARCLAHDRSCEEADVARFFAEFQKEHSV